MVGITLDPKGVNKINCKACFARCPADVLRANSLLAEATRFPRAKTEGRKEGAKHV